MIYKLSPVSKEDGNFTCAWFDDDEYLWHDPRIGMPGSLLSDWDVPELRIYSKSGSTSVLFNPGAYAVSELVKEKINYIPGVEFLPIYLQGEGVYYLLHVTTCIELPKGTDHRLAAGPSGNISNIYSFPRGCSVPSGFFRILHPSNSAAGKAGFYTAEIYLSGDESRVVEVACEGYLKLESVQSS
ncbi:hypothetical protein ACJJIE_21580 [Microbulbifer sp. TRSA001]|uniref:hypothetical protein n=1 Tax=Microbulbifer sp. TRSA001 TaxID=3243381 RepID=UPI00403A40AE